MRTMVGELVASLEADPPPVDPAELAESKVFLNWLANDHFTFLGFREYELSVVDGEDTLFVLARGSASCARIVAAAAESFASAARGTPAGSGPNASTLTKANSWLPCTGPATSTMSAHGSTPAR